MKPEEFTAKVQEVLQNLTDQAKVSTILAELTEDYNSVAVETTTAKTTAEKLTADNEKLRQANMNLFLKVGENKKPDDTNKKPEDTTPKFEDLFDEKGNLK
jgi:regulator of replication initiation timing